MRNDNRKKENVLKIIQYAIQENLPDIAVTKALHKRTFKKPPLVISIGKAAWRMAKAAADALFPVVTTGIIITKYGHSQGAISGFEIYEAGHPLVDEHSLQATRRILETVANSPEEQEILFLLSGGGSALFELPVEEIGIEDLKNIHDRLLKSGATIQEINTIRKRLSRVKGGKFAQFAFPRKITALILSDVPGNRLDMIASGPVSQDLSTPKEAQRVLKKYSINLPPSLQYVIEKENSLEVKNVEVEIVGDVGNLCSSAQTMAEKLGYSQILLASQYEGAVSECAKILSAIAKEIKRSNQPVKAPAAVFVGGETLVHVRGKGRGGRCQEMALIAAKEIKDMENVCFCSFGSDGSDGPTDAAGGMVDGKSYDLINQNGISYEDYLNNNDSYNALKACEGLIQTGPTGTNVNDLYFILVE